MVSCNACRGLVCDACAVRIERGEKLPALEAELQRVICKHDDALIKIACEETDTYNALRKELAEERAKRERAEAELKDARFALQSIVEQCTRMRDEDDDELVKDGVVTDADIRQAQALLALSALSPCDVESLALGLAGARLAGRDEARAELAKIRGER